MKRMSVITVITVFLFGMISGNALAGMMFGVQQNSFHNSMLPSDQTHGAYFGARLGEQAVLTFGVDYWKYKVDLTFPDITINGEPVEGGSGIASIGTATIRGGIKYYFLPIESDKVSPYISGEFFKGFGSASVEAEGVTVDLAPLEDILSPYGFLAGFGAEYFFSETFSFGGNIGVRYVTSKLDSDIDLESILGEINLVSQASSNNVEVTISSMTVYTGLSLNFFF